MLSFIKNVENALIGAFTLARLGPI